MQRYRRNRCRAPWEICKADSCGVRNHAFARMCIYVHPERGCKSWWFWGTPECHIPIIPKSQICSWHAPPLLGARRSTSSADWQTAKLSRGHRMGPRVIIILIILLIWTIHLIIMIITIITIITTMEQTPLTLRCEQTDGRAALFLNIGALPGSTGSARSAQSTQSRRPHCYCYCR